MAEHDVTRKSPREEVEVIQGTPDFYLTHLAHSVSTDASAMTGAISDASDPSSFEFAKQQIAKARAALDVCEREITQRENAILSADRLVA